MRKNWSKFLMDGIADPIRLKETNKQYRQMP